ncbi:enhancer of rudimentary [Mortierella sp. GBAus27b]|nr:enhancer of rudimentary [Mortierella sp. GBAus27b]
MSHTILLVQKTQAPSSKTYIECSSVATAMDEIISMYEEQLKNKYPHKERIEFDVNEVLDMVFHLPDCAALVFDQKTSTYIPHDKSWIQKQVVVRAQSRAR